MHLRIKGKDFHPELIAEICAITDRSKVKVKTIEYHPTEKSVVIPGGVVMSRVRIVITIDQMSLEELDRLVNEQVFSNRSQAIQTAIAEKLDRLNRNRLAAQCTEPGIKCGEADAVS